MRKNDHVLTTSNFAQCISHSILLTLTKSVSIRSILEATSTLPLDPPALLHAIVEEKIVKKKLVLVAVGSVVDILHAMCKD